jgi:hypothetical protein
MHHPLRTPSNTVPPEGISNPDKNGLRSMPSNTVTHLANHLRSGKFEQSEIIDQNFYITNPKAGLTCDARLLE